MHSLVRRNTTEAMERQKIYDKRAEHRKFEITEICSDDEIAIRSRKQVDEAEQENKLFKKRFKIK